MNFRSVHVTNTTEPNNMDAYLDNSGLDADLTNYLSNNSNLPYRVTSHIDAFGTPPVKNLLNATSNQSSVTPESDKVNLTALQLLNVCNISSKKFTMKDLEDRNILLLSTDAEHPITQLAKNGFHNFPYKIIEKKVILSPDCLLFKEAEEVQRFALEEESKKSGIECYWGKALPIITPEESSMALWRYNWLPLPRYCDAMKSCLTGFAQGGNLFHASEDVLTRHIATCIEKFFFSTLGNNHPLRNPLTDLTLDLKPDCAAGPFYVDLNTGNMECAIPGENLKQTAQLLQNIHHFNGTHLGTSASPLPVIIGEFKKKEAEGTMSDTCKLIVQMAIVREMMELIWENPPEFNFGYFVGDREWVLYAMKRDPESNQLRVAMVFHHTSASLLDNAYIITVMHRLAVYIRWQLTRVTLTKFARAMAQKNCACQLLAVGQKTRTNTSSSSHKRHSNKDHASPYKGPQQGGEKENTDPQRNNSSNNSSSSGQHKRHGDVVLEKLSENAHIVRQCYDGQLVVKKIGRPGLIEYEAKKLWQLQGPYVAELLSLDVIDHATSALVLPLYERHVPAPKNAKQTLALMTQLLEALVSLHDQQHLHGDVKLGNMVWDSVNQRLRLIDFETVRRFESGQKEHFYCGTRLYMAPEILLRQPANEKSDIFSAGLVIASWMHGKPINDETDRAELIDACRTQQPSKLATKSMVKLVAKMLTDSTEKRISATEALALCRQIETRLVAIKPQVIQTARTPLRQLSGNVQPSPLPLKKMAMVAQDKENIGAKVTLVPTHGTKQGLSMRK